MWAPGEQVSKLSYFGLYALQHRGQESAGIAVSDGSRILVYREMGLVAQVFNEATLESLRGHIAIGHTRYSTTGNSNWENAQPTFRTTASGHIALAHNGNLVNTAELIKSIKNDAANRGELLSSDDVIIRAGVSDTEVITSLLASSPDLPIESIALEILPKLEGAFSLVFMDEQTLFAARDRHGIRPLVLGRLESGWVVASETAALDIIGASYVREVDPGELIAIDEHGLRSSRFAEASQRTCVFEYVYLARPDTLISGKNVNAARVEVGKTLAREAPAVADLVIPVPESGTPAAIGYATESGIPFAQGLVKNSYVGRTFIEPSQSIRQIGIRLKLNPLREIIAGKSLVVVDDSIVRGNTQRAIVRMLREAGATQVHVRIASPPVQWPCFLGVDFATKSQLIAAGLDISEIKQAIGADSLAYVSMEGLVSSTNLPKQKLCRACFDGDYPVTPPEALMHESPLLELEVLTPVHHE